MRKMAPPMLETALARHPKAVDASIAVITATVVNTKAKCAMSCKARQGSATGNNTAKMAPTQMRGGSEQDGNSQ